MRIWNWSPRSVLFGVTCTPPLPPAPGTYCNKLTATGSKHCVGILKLGKIVLYSCGPPPAATDCTAALPAAPRFAPQRFSRMFATVASDKDPAKPELPLGSTTPLAIPFAEKSPLLSSAPVGTLIGCDTIP